MINILSKGGVKNIHLVDS